MYILNNQPTINWGVEKKILSTNMRLLLGGEATWTSPKTVQKIKPFPKSFYKE